MYAQDIQGSIAHARMLARQGIILEGDAEKIVSGLEAIKEPMDAGEFEWNVDDEDIHMAVESKLTSDGVRREPACIPAAHATTRLRLTLGCTQRTR